MWPKLLSFLCKIICLFLIIQHNSKIRHCICLLLATIRSKVKWLLCCCWYISVYALLHWIVFCTLAIFTQLRYSAVRCFVTFTFYNDVECLCIYVSIPTHMQDIAHALLCIHIESITIIYHAVSSKSSASQRSLIAKCI